MAYLDPTVRRLNWGGVPPALVFSMGMVSSAAAFLHDRISYGLLKYFIVESMAALCVWGLLRKINWKKARYSTRAIWIASIFLIADSVVILLRQGWHLEGFFLGSAPGYFRMPFHEDMMRNVSLVTGLLRGSESPFLAGTPLVYQTFWFHFAALCTSFFHPLSYYPLVLGCALATHWVFFLVVAWAIYLLRPGILLRWKAAFVFLTVWLFHIDIGNMIFNLASTGSLGMEADWSMQHVNHFRYLSPKFLGLVGPQHTLFLLFFLATFVFRSRRSRFVAGEWATTLFAFYTGPILFLIGFPFLWWYTRPIPWKRVALLSATATLTFQGVLGFPSWWIWFRPGSTGIQWIPKFTWHWAILPLLPVLTCGLLGVAAFFVVYRRGKRAWLDLAPAFFLLFFFNFIASSPELGRHSTMIAMILLGWFLLRWVRIQTPLEHRVWSAMASLAILGEVYLLYSYTLKPNLLRTDLPWGDYFSMNQLLRQQYPHVPVLSAIGSDLGIAKPVVGEATTSFALAVDALTHSRASEETRRILKLEDREQEILPYAKGLGYSMVAWGPVEEIMWGQRGKTRFIDPKRRLAQVGSVGLYQIEDLVYERHAQKKYRDATDSVCSLADALADAGWHFEAINLYLTELRGNNHLIRAHEGMGRSLEAMGMKRSAAFHFEKSRQLKN